MSKNLTVDEIKEKLDDLEVEYDSKLLKPDLLNLLEKTQKELSEEDVTEDSEVGEEPKKYIVLHDWKDLEDNDRVYIKDDIYPAKGAIKPTAARIKELSSTKNKQNRVLIKEQA